MAASIIILIWMAVDQATANSVRTHVIALYSPYGTIPDPMVPRLFLYAAIHRWRGLLGALDVRIDTPRTLDPLVQHPGAPRRRRDAHLLLHGRRTRHRHPTHRIQDSMPVRHDLRRHRHPDRLASHHRAHHSLNGQPLISAYRAVDEYRAGGSCACLVLIIAEPWFGSTYGIGEAVATGLKREGSRLIL